MPATETLLKPFAGPPSKTRVQRLYVEDLWAREQSAALHQWRFDEVTWENVIEEIADVGKSEHETPCAPTSWGIC